MIMDTSGMKIFAALRKLAFGLSVLCATGAAGTVHAQSLTVFAASSLKSALDEIVEAYGPKAPVNISYAGSSLLARQITQGAPADVFISAHSDWMDVVVSQRAADHDGPVSIASNALVLIGQASGNNALTSQDLNRDSAIFADMRGAHIAMGFVNAVPVGVYGKAALEHFDLWEDLAPQVVQTDNARAALNLVALGEVPYGIVYATDAHAQPRVAVLGRFPTDSHPAISYPVLQLADDAPEAVNFMKFLTSADAQTILQRHGFLPPQLEIKND
jgi:molybdate transport system substrate-binding protein